MHQCAIATSGAYSSACRHDRSDSVNQNEWICEVPSRKNWRACSDEVVTGKSFVMPMPGSSFAGRRGCAPGGTAHKSGSFTACACFPFASAADDSPVITTTRSVAETALFIAGKYERGVARPQRHFRQSKTRLHDPKNSRARADR